MRLTDSELASIIESEQRQALDYEGEIAKKRALLMDYYNCQPFGNEVDGQSTAVTSDVSDVIEWMLPSLIRIFTQTNTVARFEADSLEDDQEAEEKTQLANYAFMRQNNGTMTLHNMFKDALLQFTGVVKVSWDAGETASVTQYNGLSELEYQRLLIDPDVEIDELEIVESEEGVIYNAKAVRVISRGKVRYDNIPPEEFLIAKTARDFDQPRFIGHRAPKSRSDLLEMGFDKRTVESLPADDYYLNEEEKAARYHDYPDFSESNPSFHTPNDTIYLGEYYVEVDTDGDGITELWKVFYAGNQILEKEQVERHPFAVSVPVPIPHRAIGSCPAEQAAPIQLRKSTLVRQMLDNIYQTNYPRVLHSNKVDLDDLLTPRPGGAVGVDTNAPDVGGHAQPFLIPAIIEPIMQAIEYTDREREVRTGITRYSQGLDGESLNKTATGFRGIMDASQQRLDLIARIFADGGVRRIFELTIDVLSKNQDDIATIRVLGKPIDIDPRKWGRNIACRVDVGIGSGDRQEKIFNLNNVLQMQKELMTTGSMLSDEGKIYNSLSKLVDAVGLKDVDLYFNNPQAPEDQLLAVNYQLTQAVNALQQQIQQNPLAEAEMIKAQARMLEAQGKGENEMRKFIMEMAQKDRQFAATLAKDLTKLELEYGQDVPGSTV